MSILVQRPLKDYDKNVFDNFAPATAGFDLGFARQMMWMSQLAYETDASGTIPAMIRPWGFQDILIQKARMFGIDTRLVIGLRQNCTVVAFAGTDPVSAANLLTDAQASLDPVLNTHHGFQSAIDLAWPAIEPILMASPRPVFFTGHSLGAALAVLAAEKAFDKGMGSAAVYTFGMPRAGGPKFAERYDGKLGKNHTYRLRHGVDTVPSVPDEILEQFSHLAFRHVGGLLSCPSGGRFSATQPLSASTSNDPRFVEAMRMNLVNRVQAALAGRFLAPIGLGVVGPALALLPFGIRDHLPDRYLDALEV